MTSGDRVGTVSTQLRKSRPCVYLEVVLLPPMEQSKGGRTMTTSKPSKDQPATPNPLPVQPGTTPPAPPSKPVVHPDNWQPFTPPKD
jgi:hypothetical protein